MKYVYFQHPAIIFMYAHAISTLCKFYFIFIHYLRSLEDPSLVHFCYETCLSKSYNFQLMVETSRAIWSDFGKLAVVKICGVFGHCFAG